MIRQSSLSLLLPKAQQKRLKETAVRFGFSSDALLRRIVTDTIQALLKIPEESRDEYDNPEKIIQAHKNALREERQGKIVRSLPKSITRHRE